MTPNAFAWAALGLWPVVVLVTLAVQRRNGRLARTVTWLMLLSAMFLPSNLTFKVPGVPGLDKNRICVLALWVGLTLFHSRRPGEALRSAWFPRLVFAVSAWGVFQTVRTNPDALVFGPTTLPGLTTHDMTSTALGLFLDHYLPFALGQRVYRTERDLRDLLEVMTTCALIYAPLFLFELRMSPQLHNWVYGYHPSEFLQAVRGGGFRPMVFMNHGLVVAMFLLTGFLASLALHRAGAKRLQPTPAWRAAIAGALVLLSKSLGATIYAGVTLLAHRFLSPKALARVLVVVSALVLAYPVLRATAAFPADRVVEFFHRISPDRSASLLFRFDQEEQLLARARERPYYGWGGWGRNQIWAPWGQMISVTDGYWIIMLGAFGYVGFACFFALLLAGVVRFIWYRKRLPASAQRLCGALALLVSLFALDQLPNALPGFMLLTYAGALFSLSRDLARRPARRPRPTEAVEAGGSPPGMEPALGAAP